MKPDYLQFKLFFSLPFYPSGKKNFFYHGHVSLGLEDKIYQIYNPYLLKTDFLVSVMPESDWLYKDSRFWVDRDINSATYSHVHLYKKAELKRTAVFFTGLEKTRTGFVSDTIDYLQRINADFKNGKTRYDFIKANCTSLLNGIFYREKWVKRGCFDNIPALFFKRVVSSWINNGLDLKSGLLPKMNENGFVLHRFCLGVFSLNPMKSLSEWLNSISELPG